MEVSRIYNESNLETMAKMPDGFIDCCVTSPPYWGLRDYGVKGQIGLEETPAEFVAKLVEIFTEVRRVLKPDGSLWMNLGDSYFNSQNNNRNGIGSDSLDGPERTHVARGGGEYKTQKRNSGEWNLKPKDLCGMPWRVAFALQEAGWYLRQDIIWHKPNPMPESVRDRCTKSHEYIFLLTKSGKYFYDVDAIRQPHAEKTKTTWGTSFGSGKDYGDGTGLVAAENWANSVSVHRPKMKMPDGWDTGAGGHGSYHRDGREKGSYREIDPEDLVGVNKRSVWTVATQSFPEAHFATFPEKLIEPCILAGSRPGGIIYDPFSGAGTTALVAHKLGRNWIGSELNPEYVEIANKRLEPYLAQENLFQ